MNKNLILAVFVLAIIPIVFAQTINLDDTQSTCLGTDCEYMSGASGTITLNNCMDKLHMNVDLSGLEAGNYQLSLQTLSGDKRLDSTNICANPNGPMGGTHQNAWECGSWSDYSFYNFEMDASTTDGTFQKAYDINLPEGYYNLILLVKHDKNPDGTGGASYPIILQKSEVTFSVSDYCVSQCMEKITALEERVSALENIAPIPGPKGDNGKSAYELALENGFVGDLSSLLSSLIGAKGDQGIQGIPGLQGIQGLQGEKGEPGVCTAQCCNPEPFVCSSGALQCSGSSTQICQNNTWVITNTCQYGCTTGVCNEQPPQPTTESCVGKPRGQYCSTLSGVPSNTSKYLSNKFYTGQCKYGFGTSTECQIGQCAYTRSYKGYCTNGCNPLTGTCKL